PTFPLHCPVHIRFLQSFSPVCTPSDLSAREEKKLREEEKNQIAEEIVSSPSSLTSFFPAVREETGREKRRKARLGQSLECRSVLMVRANMEGAIKTVVTVFLKSAKGKENLGGKDFQSLVKNQLKNILTDTESSEAIKNMRQGLDANQDGKVSFQEYMTLIGYLAQSVSQQRYTKETQVASSGPETQAEAPEASKAEPEAEKEAKAVKEEEPAKEKDEAVEVVELVEEEENVEGVIEVEERT
ncbi:hypothetical protein PGIGA_G00182130, partial [Pangasianodon gigas]|nr:hypothetical protein [Pangasianodon gigas]